MEGQKILLTGGSGFLGKEVCSMLKSKGVEDVFIPRSKDYDLRSFSACEDVVKNRDIVIHLAAHVGGIGLNQKIPGELFYDNLMMGVQLMEAARKAQVKKFVSIGTICAYPKFTSVPFREEDIWNGYPEETNAPYGFAKKMLLVQGQAYKKQYNFQNIYLLPTNLYGPGDNFSQESSHVIPALIRKVHEAQEKGDKELVVWGDGSATRDFLYVEDAAEAIVRATKKYDSIDPVNIGSGKEVSIKDLVMSIVKIMEFDGKITWDTSKPNGQPRRCLDISRAKEGFDFEPKVSLEEGLRRTIDWWKEEGVKLF